MIRQIHSEGKVFRKPRFVLFLMTARISLSNHLKISQVKKLMRRLVCKDSEYDRLKMLKPFPQDWLSYPIRTLYTVMKRLALYTPLKQLCVTQIVIQNNRLNSQEIETPLCRLISLFSCHLYQRLTSAISKFLIVIKAERRCAPWLSITVLQTLHVHLTLIDEREVTTFSCTSTPMGKITIW